MQYLFRGSGYPLGTCMDTLVMHVLKFIWCPHPQRCDSTGIGHGPANPCTNIYYSSFLLGYLEAPVKPVIHV